MALASLRAEAGAPALTDAVKPRRKTQGRHPNVTKPPRGFTAPSNPPAEAAIAALTEEETHPTCALASAPVCVDTSPTGATWSALTAQSLVISYAEAATTTYSKWRQHQVLPAENDPYKRPCLSDPARPGLSGFDRSSSDCGDTFISPQIPKGLVLAPRC